MASNSQTQGFKLSGNKVSNWKPTVFSEANLFTYLPIKTYLLKICTIFPIKMLFQLYLLTAHNSPTLKSFLMSYTFSYISDYTLFISVGDSGLKQYKDFSKAA